MALETRCCVSAVLLALVFIHYLMLVEGLNNDSNEGFMYNRAVRTPSFRNNEIMTARGFGKREHGHFDISKRFDKFSTSNLDTKQNPSLQEVWPLFFQRTQPMAPRVLRDTPNLKFRLNDGNLRIGRGFGKRSENIEIKSGFLANDSRIDKSAKAIKQDLFPDDNLKTIAIEQREQNRLY